MNDEALRLTAARYALGVASSSELVQAACRTVDTGLCTPSLAELCTLSPDSITSVVRRLFEAALAELGITPPERREATLCLARHYLAGIVNGSISPRDGVSNLRVVAQRYLDEDLVKLRTAADAYVVLTPAEETVGDKTIPIGAYFCSLWKYELPAELDFSCKTWEEALKELDAFVIRHARCWLESHRV